ncbi:hypothetical protein V1506DRAFT_189653 [Lipomyces tetrasporus]
MIPVFDLSFIPVEELDDIDPVERLRSRTRVRVSDLDKNEKDFLLPPDSKSWFTAVVNCSPNWSELDFYSFVEVDDDGRQQPDIARFVSRTGGQVTKIRTWSTKNHSNCAGTQSWIMKAALQLTNLRKLSLGYLGAARSPSVFSNGPTWNILHGLHSLQLLIPYAPDLLDHISNIPGTVGLPNLLSLDFYFDERILSGKVNDRESLLRLDIKQRPTSKFTAFPNLEIFRLGGEHENLQDIFERQVPIEEEQLRLLLLGMPKLRKFGCVRLAVNMHFGQHYSSVSFTDNPVLEELDFSGLMWIPLPPLPNGIKKCKAPYTVGILRLNPKVKLNEFSQLEYIDMTGGFCRRLTNTVLLDILRRCNAKSVRTLIAGANDSVNFSGKYGRYFGDNLIQRIVKFCPNLVHLDVSYNKSFDDSCLRELLPLTSLTHLDLSGTTVTEDGVMNLLDEGTLPIRKLILDDCAYVENPLFFFDLYGVDVDFVPRVLYYEEDF